LQLFLALARSNWVETTNMHSFFTRSTFARWAALVTLALAASFAWAQPSQPSQPSGDPPARVATLSDLEGSVVFAPAGETEWVNAERNRPITRGDRLWTDEGARAAVHFG
jgi:hypothetical protein